MIYIIIALLIVLLICIVRLTKSKKSKKKKTDKISKNETFDYGFREAAFKNKTIAKEQLSHIISNPRDIQPIFGKNKSAYYNADGIIITTPYIEWLFPIDNVTEAFRKQIAVILYQFYDLGEHLGLQFQVEDDRAVLSHWTWYTNFQTGGFLLAEFEVSFSLDWNRFVEYDGHDPQKAGLEYSILSRIEIEHEAKGETLEKFHIDLYKEPGEVSSFSQVRKAARDFVEMLRNVFSHDVIQAQSNLLCDLKEHDQNIPSLIYQIEYFDKDGVIHKDRICDLHYSIYSSDTQKKIKWIYAFSESARKFQDFKLSSFLSCEPDLPPNLRSRVD